MKWVALLLVGAIAGAAPVGWLWKRAADRAAAVADSVNTIHAQQLAHQQQLAAGASTALAGAEAANDSLIELLHRPRPPLKPGPKPPPDSTVPTLLVAIHSRDSTIEDRNATIAELDKTIVDAGQLALRVRDSLTVVRVDLKALRDSLAAAPARPCPAPLEPPRLPDFSLGLAYYAGAGVSTDFRGQNARVGLNAGVGIAGKIPLRKLLQLIR